MEDYVYKLHEKRIFVIYTIWRNSTKHLQLNSRSIQIQQVAIQNNHVFIIIFYPLQITT